MTLTIQISKTIYPISGYPPLDLMPYIPSLSHRPSLSHTSCASSLSGDNKNGGQQAVIASGWVSLMEASACVGKPVKVEVDLFYPPASSNSTAAATGAGANAGATAAATGGTAATGAVDGTAGGTANSSSSTTLATSPPGSKLFGRLSVTLVVDAKEQPRVIRSLPTDFQQGVLRIIKLKTFDLTNTEAMAMFGDKQGKEQWLLPSHNEHPLI